MGLDFGVYWRKKNAYTDRDFIDNELCYGRKSWELVYALGLSGNEPDLDREITLDEWVGLIEKLVPIGDYLDEIWDAFDKYENAPEDFGDEILTKRDKMLIATYEKWYNATFDISPQLGYFFSVGYMKSFWDAKDEVVKYLEDPDYEVWAYVSY